MNRTARLRSIGFGIPLSLAACMSLNAAEAPIRGEYRKIAACVFKQLDPLSPGNFRLTTLPDEIVITFETTGGGMTFRDLKATFTAAGRNETAIEIEGRPPGYYPSKVRPLAMTCATEQ